MKKINKFILSVVFIYLGLTGLQAKTSIKNLYILIEPTSISNSINEKGKPYNSILNNSKRIVKDVVKWAKENKVKRIFINSKELTKNTNEHIFINKIIKKELFKKKKYNVSKILEEIHNNFFANKLKVKDTLLLYIGDIDFIKNGVSSHGGYLNSGWLNNPNSPFVKKFIKADNSSLQGIPVVIITRTQIGVINEKKRESFLLNLFSSAGMKVFYIGNSYRNLPTRTTVNFIVDKIEKVANKVDKPLKIFAYDKIKLCQIIYDDYEINIPSCGGN